MRDGAIDVVGGAGGTHARTEDLARAASALGYAREHVESVAAWARVARANAAADPLLVDGLALSPAHVDDALAWVNHGPGGAEAVAREIGEMARGLAETVTLLESAESHAGGLWGGLRDAAEWAVRHAKSSVEVEAWLGTRLAQLPLALTGTPLLVDPVDPDWTTVLDPDIVEAGIGLADSIPIVPWLTDFTVRDLLLVAILARTMTWAEILGNPHGLAVKPESTRIAAPPRDTAELVGRTGDLGRGPDGDSSSMRIAIESIESPDGSRAWIVEIPGTADFLPAGGSNPSDINSDLQMVAGGNSDVMVGVVDAMRQAGIAPGEPVLIAGHSLGGIAAASLASNDAVAARFDIRAVTTAGACTAPFGIPDSTSVLSLENTTDLVPALDGARNPDRGNWVTVRHDLRASTDPLDREAARSIVDSHEIPAYRRTAALFDDSSSASARKWREDNAGFFADGRSTSTRTVYTITRGTDDATLASVED